MIAHEEQLIGDIVYWVEGLNVLAQPCVCFGLVKEFFVDGVIVSKLRPRDRRRINGIPFNDFPEVTKLTKLPKTWSYNTVLFNTEFESYRPKEEEFMKNITTFSPTILLEAYYNGYLIEEKDYDYRHIESVITKDGYYLRKTFSQGERNKFEICKRYEEVYLTYEEAKQVCTDYVAELHRQASLSDYDWSVELIKKTIDRLPYATNEYRTMALDFLLERDRVEDIEVRIYGGNLQWKYDKNKKWLDIIF